jgi:hypothetical protein
MAGARVGAARLLLALLSAAVEDPVGGAPGRGAVASLLG